MGPMVLWIVLGVVALAVLFGVAVLRAMWRESSAKIDALPAKSERRTWPVPGRVGDRIMWCPILARKVVVAETMLEEGSLGTVVRITDDGHPAITFDLRPGVAPLVDKWGAARVVPPAHDHRVVRTGPQARSGKKRAKKRR